MNQLERTIKRVVKAALKAFAESLDDDFGDESAALPITDQHYEMLALEIEALVEKTLREAGIFPELENGWPIQRKISAA